MGMTPEQKERFLQLLGQATDDPLVWDELPIAIKRLLVMAAGVGQHVVFMSWRVITEGDRAALTRAAGELMAWAEFTRNKMQQKPEGVAA